LEDTPYRNTLSLQKRADGTPTHFEKNDIDNLVWGAVLLLIGISISLLFMYNTQYAFNAVTLTQFAWIKDTSNYELRYAGDTKPLYCLIIAFSLLACSLLIGWQSKRHAYVRNWYFSFVACCFVGIVQILGAILHYMMLFGNDNLPGKNILTIFMITNTGMLFLHTATAIITVTIIVTYALQPADPEDKVLAETQGNFWLCVAEDLNMIVVYAFIFRACSSQISVHDDTATFFDVLCVVVIGFLQHIANILMIFHAHIKIDKDVTIRPMQAQMAGQTMNYTQVVDTTPLIKSTDKIIKSIARTRALVFFMIAVVTVFLYLRIAPTCEEFPAGIPFELLRSLALVSMISLNTLQSLSFEMQGSDTSKPWDTSPTWKLLTTGLIACIAAAFLLADVSTHKDKEGPYAQETHKYLMSFTYPPPS